jgi:broad specificity phosphatase PhoE
VTGDNPIDPRAARIFFVRHGEVHNPRRIFYGRLPRFRLSDTGKRQAAAAAHLLAREPLAAIYTSPLLRARQTGQIIAREHPAIPVRISRSILEIRTQLQGGPTADLDATNWNFYEPRLHEDDETMAMIATRIARFCRTILRQHPGQAVAAVTHGDIVAIARAMFEERPLVLASIRGDVYPATASILRVTLGPDLRASEVDYRVPVGSGQ